MIHFINQLGADFSHLTLALLLQSTSLAAALVVFDLLLGRRLRSSLRYGLWLLFVIKLVLPPSLSLPTGIGYWLAPNASSPVMVQQSSNYEVTITDVDPTAETRAEPASIQPVHLKSNTFSLHAKLFIAWAVGALLLSLGMMMRNAPVKRLIGEAEPASAEHRALLLELAEKLGLRRIPDLCLSRAHHSPAVCGLLRPVIVIPSKLAEELSPDSLRLVLLHELIHVCRRDLWVNRFQALVQVLWWWNPIVWMVNSHVRTLREQSVDESVMLALPHDRTVYPTTLVEVARHCATRPMLALSFLGIFESRRTLRSRVKRLLSIDLPRSASLGWSGWSTLVVAALVAWPMAFEGKVKASPADQAANPLVVAQAQSGSQNVDGSTIDANQLFTRTYRLDSELFLRNINRALGPLDSFSDGTNDTSVVQELVRMFIEFAELEIPVPNAVGSTPEQSQKAAFYNQHTGTLFVRATEDDMEAIERALRLLTVRTASILVEVKFIEMEASEPKTLGFDWFLGDTHSGERGADTSEPKTLGFDRFSTISPHELAAGKPPTDFSSRQALPSIPSGGVFPQSGGSASASLPNVTGAKGILTDEEYRIVLKALEARPGTRVLAAPRVLTLGGRQAQISLLQPVELMNADGTTYPAQVGSVVDVIPSIAEDNYSIQLILTVDFTAWNPDSPDNPISGSIRRARFDTTALVPDGQTLALFGHVLEHPVTAGLNPPPDHPDITPTNTRIIVFVTSSIIDGKGNRIHTPDQGK